MFADILGNEHIKTLLCNAITAKTLPNSLLFHGPQGLGKGLFAQELAKKLIYLDSSEKKTHLFPDLHIYSPEEKSNLHSMQSMREMIEEIYKPPFMGMAKVFIIDAADKMLPSSANAILKTLEEPNQDSYIILVTDAVQNILPTIRSRCMQCKFLPNAENIIQEYVQTKFSIGKKLAKYITKLSEGAVGKAHILSSDRKLEKRLQLLLEILRSNECPSIGQLDNLFTDIAQDSYDLDLIFSTILMWYRDLSCKLVDPSYPNVYFEEKVSLTKIPSLEKVHYLLDVAKKGMQRNLKLSHCFLNFFLQIK